LTKSGNRPKIQQKYLNLWLNLRNSNKDAENIV